MNIINAIMNIAEIILATIITKAIPMWLNPRNARIPLQPIQQTITRSQYIVITMIIVQEKLVKIIRVVITPRLTMNNKRKAKGCNNVNDNLLHNVHNSPFINIGRKYVT